MEKKAGFPYEDILEIDYPFPTNRVRMSMHDRAAQFGSFAALTGHEEAIWETARYTSVWVEPDEDVKEQLNRKLQMLMEQDGSDKQVEITYFEPDVRKAGGSYQVIAGSVKKVDMVMHEIILKNGLHIYMERIIDIEIAEKNNKQMEGTYEGKI